MSTLHWGNQKYNCSSPPSSPLLQLLSHPFTTHSLTASGHATLLKTLHCLPAALAIKSRLLPLPAWKDISHSFPPCWSCYSSDNLTSFLSECFTLPLILPSCHTIDVTSAHSPDLDAQVRSIPHWSYLLHHLMLFSSWQLSPSHTVVFIYLLVYFLSSSLVVLHGNNLPVLCVAQSRESKNTY